MTESAAIARTPPKGNVAQARFIKILEATTDVVAMTDREGRLLYLNAAGRRFFGWPGDDSLRNRSIASMHPSWAAEVIVNESIPHARSHGSWSGEVALTGRDGREVPVTEVVLAHAGTDGSVEFLSAICRDISDRKHRELEQIEWANRYDAAVRSSGQVLFDWDSSTGGITYGGDVARLFGFEESELRGGVARLREIIKPDDLAGFDSEIDRVLNLRDPFHHEFRVVRKDGGEIIVNAQGFFFLDRAGNIGRMVGFLKDVTAERTAEHAIHDANERLELRVHQRTAELEKLAVELQDSARQQAAVARLGQRALAGLSLDALMKEAVALARDGLSADCSAVLDFLPDENVFIVRTDLGWPPPVQPVRVPGGLASQSGYTMQIGAPVVSIDFRTEQRFQISESVKASGLRSGISVCIQAGSRPLGVLNAFSRNRRQYGPDDVSFLQGLANVLTAAIERHRVEEDTRRAQAEAEAANRAKSEFMSRMSHELRTPLNAILGFTQLLEMEEHDERQDESIRHISRAGQNLLQLINEVLEIARLDAGRIQFHVEDFELSAFLRETATLSKPIAARHRVTIHFGSMPGGTPIVRTDRERLKQVFLNLLSNAAKYNRPEGTVTIAVTRAGSERWRVSVTDTGRGIAPERLDRIFIPFEQLGVKEGATEGGIGLALCHRLVNALGGELGVESALGEGSTFWVQLPSAEPEAAEAAEPVSIPLAPMGPAPASSAQRTVLYIEDDIANYHLLERILQSRKELKLVSAHQGSLGLDLAREHVPDLILLDLNLPDMTGEQLLRDLKASARTKRIPVIAVTGEVAGDRPDELRRLGALAMLTKPYRVQELITLIDRALSQPAANDPSI
jgi:PAS domain S-box-containing protein